MNAAQVATETRRQQAEGRLRVIRNALSMADEELEKVLVNRDWEVFGLDSFAAYCSEMIPEFRHFKMKPEPRQERILRLRAAGGTMPDLAAATNSSLGTVHRTLERAEGGHKRASAFQVETPAPLLAEDVAALTNWQSVVRHVGRAGQRGQTCLEFEAESAWGHGKSSAAFHAAERKGYISRDGRFRGPYAVYVTASRP